MRAVGFGPARGVDQTEATELGMGEIERAEHGTLGIQVPEARGLTADRQLRLLLLAVDPVGPQPADRGDVPAPVLGAQHKFGSRDPRRREGVVG